MGKRKKEKPEKKKRSNLPKGNSINMKIFVLVCIIHSINAQSPFANTLDVSNGIRQFTKSFLIDFEESSQSNFVFSPYSIRQKYQPIQIIIKQPQEWLCTTVDSQ